MGYLEFRWGCSVPWGVILSTVGGMMHVGDIMSTVGSVQYRGGIFCYFSTPTVLNTHYTGCEDA